MKFHPPIEGYDNFQSSIFNFQCYERALRSCLSFQWKRFINLKNNRLWNGNGQLLNRCCRSLQPSSPPSWALLLSRVVANAFSLFFSLWHQRENEPRETADCVSVAKIYNFSLSCTNSLRSTVCIFIRKTFSIFYTLQKQGRIFHPDVLTICIVMSLCVEA